MTNWVFSHCPNDAEIHDGESGCAGCPALARPDGSPAADQCAAVFSPVFVPLTLPEVRELLVEAEGIEAHYGANAYVDYLRRHHHRPDPQTAITIGRLLGGCVRADDGKLYPRN